MSETDLFRIGRALTTTSEDRATEYVVPELRPGDRSYHQELRLFGASMVVRIVSGVLGGDRH